MVAGCRCPVATQPWVDELRIEELVVTAGGADGA
jgi:hypothetical protein